MNDETGHNFRMNTCLAMGELAEYYEYFGYGWPINKEDAIKSCEQSIDEGMVIEHFYGKTSEVICNYRRGALIAANLSCTGKNGSALSFAGRMVPAGQSM